MLAVGASALVLARLTSIGPGLALYFLFDLAQGPLNVCVMPLLLHATPRELVGRVSSVLEPAIMLASVASMVVVGILDSTVLQGLHLTALGMRFGPVDTIYTAVAMLMLIAGVYAMFSLRGVKVALNAPSTVDAQEPGD